MIKKIFKIIINILNITLIALSIILALIAIFKKEWIEAFIEWMKIVINWLWNWNYIIAFFSSLAEAFPVIWVVLPWQNILLIVWWFFGQISQTNLIYIIIIASIWAIIWNFIWFILWKYYWEHFFEKYWLWFGIWKTEVKYLKLSINKWWMWWIILWKFHPLTRSFLPFIAGSIWMKSKLFMIYNILWSIIRSSTIIILWVIFIEYYKIILEYIWTIFLVIIVLIIAYLYFYKKEALQKYLKEKNDEIEEQSRKIVNKK